MPGPTQPWKGASAVFATMHGKQQVVAPVLGRFLGVHVDVPKELDTDRFGTFTREVPRLASALDTARAKAQQALAADAGARLGIASEGSFGPDPVFPFIAAGQELLVIIDRESDLELVGRSLDRRTNFAATLLHSVEEAIGFAARARFPSHALIAMAAVEGRPAPRLWLRKGIVSATELLESVATLLKTFGAAHLETDMRAHCNPTRMRAIKRATLDLARRYHCPCPACGRPGYAATARKAGLPCADCGSPTTQMLARVWTCSGCAARREEPVEAATADPRYCDLCNP